MIDRYKEIKKSAIFFFVSYISILVFSFSLYVVHIHQVFSYDIIVKSVITSIVLWYILYLSSFHKWFYYFILFLLALMTTIKIYYAFVLGVHIEPSIFEGMFDTNFDEAKRLGSSKPIVIFFAILSFFAILVEFYWFKKFAFKKRVKIHLLKIVVILCLLIGYGFYRNDLQFKSITKFIHEIYPISFIESFYKAVSARYKLYQMNKSKIDIVKKYNFVRESKDKNLTVVFVRAESLRARSFPITDKNLPLLYRLDDLNNTVYFQNVFSYANYTQAAVPWMLTRSVDDKLQNEKSLISVVSHLGFDTTWVGCDHSNLANFATPIVNYSLEANRSLFLGKLHNWLAKNRDNGIDGLLQKNIRIKNIKNTDILPQQKYFNEVVGFNSYDGLQFAYLLSKIKDKNKGNSFFWIEMNGSHVPWTILVPKQFRIYKPMCDKVIDEIKECSQKEAQNAYKNTIIYTQYLLKKLIISLKDKNAIVFFASDHGESTGENGYYGHGFMLPEDKRKIRDQINPAFMVWMSDKFKHHHEKEYYALMNNAQKNMKHNVIFHSVLDILGIKSSIINKRNSIFTDAFIGIAKQVEVEVEKNNTIIDKFENNKLIFHLKDTNPNPIKKYQVRIHSGNKLNHLSFYISDLYKNRNYPNRIKYRVLYKDTVILEKDLADDDRELISVDFQPDDHNITIEVEVKKGIESGWAWGKAAKIKVDFIHR
jgi:glucan phosphoethanolaminetransferase (alkaline phosphatase superfamily)